MANKMLMDASHPEETRVVVLRGNRVQEFDFEAADKKPLRGNIYLAKVTRVEPSLQAAFVDYGGNRHGFLAFAEIHPDYYQIPVADRQALLEEESRAHQLAEEEEHRPHARGRRSRRRSAEVAEKRVSADDGVISESAPLESEEGEANASENASEVLGRSSAERAAGEAGEAGPTDESAAVVEGAPASVEKSGSQSLAAQARLEPASGEAREETTAEASADVSNAGAPADDIVAQPISVDPEGFGVIETGASEVGDDVETPLPDHEAKARRQDERDAEHEREREEARQDRQDEDREELDEDHDEEAEHVEHIGGDAMEEVPYRRGRLRRQYKIQEVIKRRQVLLVQVVKEERGTKGAALTTYLSLAGRYSVLMPNTARGGGISRKITDGADRKRLKDIVHELEVPEGMGVILRTAGATRTKAEVKRDFEYLLRVWESVRELTLRSSAPTLVYEEGSLIKRAIRDLYGRDVEEVVVSGEDAYREAKEFMRMLIPSHAKNVRPYREPYPIFAAHGAEAQLDAMFSNHVTLRSGGYLVINQTEALVAIDVNSGRATREHNIEDTALRTNLEAADEVARQLRLRDLAGLIVVDFIDMEESRNNRAVERRLKDALKNDRARIQVGRISHFGLLEMSRQRIRAGVLEGSTVPCPHCAGAGAVRSTSSIALHVLRVLEDALVKSAAHDITLRTRTAVTLYILNQKRAHLTDLERRFGVAITVAADDTLTGTAYHALERGEPASGAKEPAPVRALRVDSLPIEPFPAEEEIREEARDVAAEESSAGDGQEARPATPGGEAEEGEGGQRGRRRRRRRGRGGVQSDHGATLEPAPGGEQPSDEGLGLIARIVPTQASVARRGPDRAGRGRRLGRWIRSTPLPPEYRDAGVVPADEGAEATADFASPPEAHEPRSALAEKAELPVQEVPPGAEGAVELVSPSERRASPFRKPASQPASPAEAPPMAEAKAPPSGEAPPPSSETALPPLAAEAQPLPREPTRAVITEADPNRPKRAGWWQRAKPTLDGN